MITLYGKDALLSRLGSFRRSGRFPHALMLCGDDGVGKRTAARYIAMLYLCREGGEAPCGKCNECSRVENGIHPDVLLVKQKCDGKYSVGAMREIIDECYYRPNDSDVRVVIFENMQDMRPDCQNTLLKFIEEPLGFNRYVFTADSIGAVLPTIASRVVSLSVTDASAEQCRAALAANGLPASELDSLIGLCGGNIGKCIESYSDESGRGLSELVGEIAAGIAAKNEFAAAVAFSCLNTREMQKKGLLLLLNSVSDAMKYSLTEGNSVGAAAALSRSVPLKKLYDIAELLTDIIQCCEYNPNVQLLSAECAGGIFKIIM